MESWILVLNRVEGESYTYRFANEPERYDDDGLRLIQYTGEGLEVLRNGMGDRKIRRVTNIGKYIVAINLNHVVNWYVKREELDYEPEEG